MTHGTRKKTQNKIEKRGKTGTKLDPGVYGGRLDKIFVRERLFGISECATFDRVHVCVCICVCVCVCVHIPRLYRNFFGPIVYFPCGVVQQSCNI